MTKAVSSREICFIEAVLLLCEHGRLFQQRRKWCFIPPPNTIRAKHYWFLDPGEETREAVRPARPEEEHDGQGSQFRAPPL